MSSADKNAAEVIAAIATAPGRGGIGVVRVSGKNLAAMAQALTEKNLVPRVATFTSFYSADKRALDQGLALFFPAPQSFTGEDVIELQGHGGNAVLQLILQRCIELGARIAQPGEFTRRAFLNDKLDLLQAESVADLIEASTAEAAQSAMRSLSGEFSQQIHSLVDGLTHLRALVEATLDFPEEEIDFIQVTDAANRLKQLRAQLDALLANAKQGQLLREGLQVVLIGQPNVGKSSLMNKLAGEDVSIVTPIAGTTRDSIKNLIIINGIAMHVIDTAGLRESDDEVEKIGIARTYAAIEKAGIVLVIRDTTQANHDYEDVIRKKLPASLPVVFVHNKIDLAKRTAQIEQRADGTHIYLSAKNGEGVDLLRQHLLQLAGWHNTGEGIYMARRRHTTALEQAAAHLTTALLQLSKPELFAEELRLAQARLSDITGEFSADDLLGEIFSRFCIGK
ncbi:MAG: tRNA uridine-5-carboxymethylaminomethyl(34) synthesis GTPase MnmE [Pseudomonadota bacterium]|jgi:tRNA modification GTPase